MHELGFRSGVWTQGGELHPEWGVWASGSRTPLGFAERVGAEVVVVLPVCGSLGLKNKDWSGEKNNQAKKGER